MAQDKRVLRLLSLHEQSADTWHPISHALSSHMQFGKDSSHKWNTAASETCALTSPQPLHTPPSLIRYITATLLPHRLHQNLYPKKHTVVWMQFDKTCLKQPVPRLPFTAESSGDRLTQLPPTKWLSPTWTQHPGWNIKWSKRGHSKWASMNNLCLCAMSASWSKDGSSL